MNEKYVKTKMDLARIRSEKLKGIKTSLEIQGSGPLNRDGVPELPPEQKATDKWPVLDLGVQPTITTAEWMLEVKGDCEHPCRLTYFDLLKMPVIADTSDFHCVTGWSRLQIHWRGVRFSDIAKKVSVRSSAQYVFIQSYDDYTTNLSLDEAMKYDVLLAFEAEGHPLEKEHGGPVRMITPQLWAWKGAKWIRSIEFIQNDKRGFWEQRGYSNSAIPWLNDRYTKDEVTN